MLRKLAWIAGALALCIGVQFAAGALLNAYLIRIIAVCTLNVMLAVSLNLVNGTTGQFSIGHAGFLAVGAYASAITSFALDAKIHAVVPAFFADGVTLVIAALAGVLAAGIAGVLVGVPSLRLRGDYLAIVTLGFGEIIRISIESTPAIGGSQGYPLGYTSIPGYAKLAWILGGAMLVVALTWNLTYSSHGRALAAIREDEIAAEAVGVDTTRYKVLAFAVSAMLTGLAGALYAHDATGGQHIDPGAFRLDRSVDMLVMIIFGGLGSITGAVIGGLFVGILLELLKELPNLLGGGDGALVRMLRDNAGNVRLIVYALSLVLLMLLRPQGLLGTREFSLKALLGRRKKAAS
ncbi:MAG: branched-chain amino acid ABC transporter permease [Deltaproteobacteria bacterium]|nr:branched-chain amino acid ABC transporter permease [Deltaproteobacteria bacterium]